MLDVAGPQASPAHLPRGSVFKTRTLQLWYQNLHLPNYIMLLVQIK